MAKRKSKSQQVAAKPSMAADSRSVGSSWLVSQENGLRLLVFVAGLVLMGLEISGSRILAPLFGNSVFVWGSLISVFLIALATGYYVGGRLVDRRPSQILLNLICMAVSVWIFALASFGQRICGYVESASFGEQIGPLITSAILFLPPSVGLGIVSPFSIRIAATSIQSIGQVSGTLYALSTVGSIVGTLLATFVLTPLMGVTAILRILALLLLLASIVALPIPRRGTGIATLLVVAMMIGGSLLVPTGLRVRLRPDERIILDEDTPYHHVTVIENGVQQYRQLRFDRDTESGVFLKEPHITTEGYPNYFHLAFLARPKMNRVLFIGAGGGVGPRAFLAHDGELQIDVVDIDRRVLDVAQEYFYLQESPSLRLVAQDGRMFLRKTTNEYDCIVLDAFTGGGRIPFHLVTREFLELCRDRLTGDGLFAVNIGSALEGPISGIYRSMYRTMSEVFPNVYVFAREYRVAGMTRMTNIILLASKDANRIPESEWIERAGRYQSNSYVTTRVMKMLVADQIVETKVDPAAPIFTDDFAAIETMF